MEARVVGNKSDGLRPTIRPDLSPIELPPRETTVQMRSISRTAVLILNALADENKVWDSLSLSEAFGISDRAAQTQINHLFNFGYVRKNVYRLTPEAKASDKGMFLPIQLKIVDALHNGGMTLGELLKVVKVDTPIIQDTLDSLISRELVLKVRFQASVQGRETLKGLGSFGEVYDLRVRILLRIAGGDRTIGQLENGLAQSKNSFTEILQGLEKSNYISRLVQERYGSPIVYYGLTKEGRVFLSRYLIDMDGKEQFTPTQSRKISAGEVKVRILEAVANAPQNSDVRWIYAELPFEYSMMVKAFNENISQGLIGQNRIRMIPNAEMPIFSNGAGAEKIALSKQLLETVSKRPSTIEQLSKKLKADEDVIREVIDQLGGVITIERLFLTEDGAALLASSKTLLTKPLLRTETLTKLKALTPDNMASLQQLAKNFGTPEMEKMSRDEKAVVKQAKVILLAVEEKSNAGISKQLGLSLPYPAYAIKRFNENGMRMFDPSFRKRKPPKPKVKVRELNIGEVDKIEDMANRFNTQLKGRIPPYEYLKLRSAKIVRLSSQEVLASEIAQMTNTQLTMVFRIIHNFNNLGMEIFSEQFGLRKPKHPARKLTPEEFQKVSEMAATFEAFDIPTGPHSVTREFARARHAMVILLSTQETPVRLIAERVKIKNTPTIHAIINRFNKEGMAIFENTQESKPRNFVMKLSDHEADQLRKLKKWWTPGNESGLERLAYAAASSAKIILASNAGLSVKQINEQTGISEPVINRTIRNFNKHGIALFKQTDDTGGYTLLLRTAAAPSFRKVRELSADEQAALLQLSQRYDTQQDNRLTYKQLVWFRRAKMLLMSTEGKSADEIADYVDVTSVSVYNAINGFERDGMAMFPKFDELLQDRNMQGKGAGLRKAGHPSTVFARELTRPEKKTLEEMAAKLSGNGGTPKFALWKAKRAAAVLMSAQYHKPVREVAQNIGMSVGSTRFIINEFNESGMRIFSS